MLQTVLTVLFFSASLFVGGCGKDGVEPVVADRAELEAVVQAASFDELLDPQALKEAYVRANGGWLRLEKLLTTSIRGQMERDGVSRPFFVLKSRPDRALMTFNYTEHELTFGVDGTDVWKRVTVHGEEPQFSLVEGPAADGLIESAIFLVRSCVCSSKGRALLKELRNQSGTVLLAYCFVLPVIIKRRGCLPILILRRCRFSLGLRPLLMGESVGICIQTIRKSGGCWNHSLSNPTLMMNFSIESLSKAVVPTLAR